MFLNTAHSLARIGQPELAGARRRKTQRISADESRKTGGDHHACLRKSRNLSADRRSDRIPTIPKEARAPAKVQAFIAEDMQERARMFPDEFWSELARLEGIHHSARSRPIRWGSTARTSSTTRLTATPGKSLRRKNPVPHFKQNHHQSMAQGVRQAKSP